ncbi:hypothetical protein SGLAM104S_09908 [Streptomyces glaucescens]
MTWVAGPRHSSAAGLCNRARTNRGPPSTGYSSRPSGRGASEPKCALSAAASRCAASPRRSRSRPPRTYGLSSLGLHTIFDFRNAADQKLEGPDVELPGVRNVNLPLSDPADGAEFWKTVRDGDLDQLREILADGKAAARWSPPPG